MTRRPEPAPQIVAAARDLEEEIRRCELSLAEVAKVRLNSEKNLARAGRALQRAHEHHERLGARVGALAQAIVETNRRAEEAAAGIQARAAEIQARLEVYRSLQDGAGELSTAVRELGDKARESTPQKIELPELRLRLEPIEKRLVDEQARARADGFEDVANQLDGLRQMVGALRRTLEKLPSGGRS